MRGVSMVKMLDGNDPHYKKMMEGSLDHVEKKDNYLYFVTKDKKD